MKHELIILQGIQGSGKLHGQRTGLRKILNIE